MRMSAFLLITALVTPALAAEGDEKLKVEVEQIGAAYADSFNKQDGAGSAGLYASGGVHVGQPGRERILLNSTKVH